MCEFCEIIIIRWIFCDFVNLKLAVVHNGNSNIFDNLQEERPMS